VNNPLHRLALVAMGVSIFDNLDFERAAEEARRLNRYEFLFMAAPLRIEKGTGSPLNPLAIF
jgi:kynurenine formamidase